MLFSLLITTLESRHEKFQKLYNKLTRQISENSLVEEVEIVYFLNNKI